jgi:hypothetical protein
MGGSVSLLATTLAIGNISVKDCVPNIVVDSKVVY